MASESTEQRLAALLVDLELAAGGTDASSRVYQRAFDELAPIIGARGVRGIFARALELVQRTEPALDGLVAAEDPKAAACTLDACLARAPAQVARKAAHALYTAFFGLIVTFVGTALTIQLLRAAWPDADFDFKETP